MSVLNEMLSGIGRVRPNKVKIGVVGTMRKVFQEEYGKVRFREVVEAAKKDPRVEIITLEPAGVPDGIIYAGELAQTRAAINLLLNKRIEGLVIAPCNYGDEEAAATIAGEVYKARGIPIYTYVWPDAPINVDGTRVLDNECGIFPMRMHMASRMKKQPGYFPFGSVDDIDIRNAWDLFVRACSGLHSIRNVKLLQIGADQPTFYAIEGDPFQMREKFNLRVETKDISTLIKFVNDCIGPSEEPPEWFQPLRDEIFETFDFSATRNAMPMLPNKLTLILGWVIEQMKATQSNSLTIRCWDELFKILGTMVCCLNGLLFSKGIMAPCETDKPGVLASALMYGLGIGDEDGYDFFADLTRWDNGRPLWWHCGPFPPTGLRCRGEKAKICAGWIFPGITCGGLIGGQWGQLCDAVTFCQIRPNPEGKFTLVGMNGKICDGPSTIGTHFYTSTKDKKATWKFIMENPFDHHNSGRKGNLLPALEKVAPWLGLDTEPAFLDNIGGD